MALDAAIVMERKIKRQMKGGAKQPAKYLGRIEMLQAVGRCHSSGMNGEANDAVGTTNRHELVYIYID
jgi:hypothetical protein